MHFTNYSLNKHNTDAFNHDQAEPLLRKLSMKLMFPEMVRICLLSSPWKNVLRSKRCAYFA